MTAPNTVPPGADSPAPAEQAVGSGTSNLAGDEVAPEWFVPQSTQDNYAQIARDRAAVTGVEPRQIMQELADQWEQLHERQPLDGYDHLAAWGRQFDPAAGQAPTGLAVLQARALESARRDPYQAVIGDQSLVEQAVTSQHAADEAAIGAAAAPSVDPASGLLPGGGPLPVPSDVSTGDPAVAEQQQAAAEQREGGEQQPEPSPAPAPEPTPTPAPPTSGKGSRSGSGSGGSSGSGDSSTSG
jgi:hypothetical protein